jgi:DNA-binding NtrC family response regulator
MTVPWEVMVISSDLENRQELVHILQRQDVDPLSASSIAESLSLLKNNLIGLVFCEVHLCDGSYRDLLSSLRSLKSKCRVVVTSRQADWGEFLEATRLGAFDVIAAPCRPTDVEWMVIQAKRDERSRLVECVAASATSTERGRAAGQGA